MNASSYGWPVLRIEICHGFLLFALAALLVPRGSLDAWGLLLGGLFMGVNFLLLSFGIRWLLSPFAARGRIRAGIVLLVLKMLLFLGLLSALFFRIRLNATSFAVGVSSLLAAVVIERVWTFFFNPSEG